MDRFFEEMLGGPASVPRRGELKIGRQFIAGNVPTPGSASRRAARKSGDPPGRCAFFWDYACIPGRPIFRSAPSGAPEPALVAAPLLPCRSVKSVVPFLSPSWSTAGCSSEQLKLTRLCSPKGGAAEF
jgi:hypothetical protein